jgi:ribonuclease HI
VDINLNDLIIYTDGSSRPGPRRGGFGIRIITIDSGGNEVISDIVLPGYKGATNNEMELFSCIAAIKEISRSEYSSDLETCNKVIIKTDSQYVRDNFISAKYYWPKSKWTLRDGAPVLNAEIWKQLTKVIDSLGKPVEIIWVKGKKGINEKAVDKIAKRSANMANSKPLTIKSVRRKSIDAEVCRGSVQMEGQDMLIRVRECQWLKTQKLWKLKYEVIDTDSNYFGCVDILFSKSLVKDGHCYVVTLNAQTNNPQIAEVLCEV